MGFPGHYVRFIVVIGQFVESTSGFNYLKIILISLHLYVNHDQLCLLLFN